MVKFLAVVSTRSGSSFVSLASLSRISTAVTMLVRTPHIRWTFTHSCCCSHGAILMIEPSHEARRGEAGRIGGKIRLHRFQGQARQERVIVQSHPSGLASAAKQM